MFYSEEEYTVDSEDIDKSPAVFTKKGTISEICILIPFYLCKLNLGTAESIFQYDLFSHVAFTTLMSPLTNVMKNILTLIFFNI